MKLHSIYAVDLNIKARCLLAEQDQQKTQFRFKLNTLEVKKYSPSRYSYVEVQLGSE